MSLDDWQLNAIQRLLGIELHEDGTSTEFPREFVEEQLKKIGKWSIVIND